MNLDNVPQLLFNATLLLAFLLMCYVLQLLLKPVKKLPKRDKLKEIRKILEGD